MQSPAIGNIIRRLQLKPHPEGGSYRETYRADGAIPAGALPSGFEGKGKRPWSTAIYFLLTEGECSRMHRLKSDEIWHFYAGGPLTLVEMDEARGVRIHTLGNNLAKGQVPQVVIPAGRWFGAHPADGTQYTLAGCTVAPGFDFKDFELAQRDDLLKLFPQSKDIIERLTLQDSPVQK